MRIFIAVLVLLLTCSWAVAQQQAPVPPDKPAATSDCRSAKTGKYVTAAYAKRHPKTTVCEARK